MADRYCTLQVINALGNGITLGISVFLGQLGRRYGPLPHKFAYAEAGGTTTITEISPNCTQGATVTSRAHWKLYVYVVVAVIIFVVPLLVSSAALFRQNDFSLLVAITRDIVATLVNKQRKQQFRIFTGIKLVGPSCGTTQGAPCNNAARWHPVNQSACYNYVHVHASWSSGMFTHRPISCNFVMVALCNRADHYIFALWFLSSFFLSSSFFPRLISAVRDWMSTILPHMVWL